MAAHDGIDSKPTRSLASELPLVFPKQPFKPKSLWILHFQLASVKEIAFRNDPDQRSGVVHHRQTALLGELGGPLLSRQVSTQHQDQLGRRRRRPPPAARQPHQQQTQQTGQQPPAPC